MKIQKIALFVGSLRQDSFNRKMAQALIEMAPRSMQFEVIEIGNLPLYNQDLDETPPQEWTDLRRQIKSTDAVLFITPEYNRSVPGVLKNAIDIASRPYGKNVLDKKPGAVISVTIGQQGAFGANHHLRQCLAYLNVPTLTQPEMYISKAQDLFGQKGQIKNADTKKLVQKFIKTFHEWINTINNKGKAYEKETQPRLHHRRRLHSGSSESRSRVISH